MQKINITTKIEVDQHIGWPQELPVTIYPKHYNLNDKIWLVYVRDRIGSYDIFVGEVIVTGVRMERRLAAHSGSLWRYAYYYTIDSRKGNKIFDEWREVADYQVFNTKQEAVDNIRNVAIKRIEEDSKRHSKYLAISNNALQQLKDRAIELRYGSIE